MNNVQLREHIRKVAVDNGALVVGFTKIRHMEPVIVFGFPFIDEWFLKHPFNTTKRLGKNYLTSKKVQDLVAQILTREGHRVEYKTVLSLYGDFRPMAVAAGLGKWGRNGLVVNRQYGSGLLFASLFTNAPLEAETTGNYRNIECLCSECNNCVLSCPARAFEHNRFHLSRCLPNAVRGCAECLRACRSVLQQPLN